MEEDFVTFKKFQDNFEAIELINLLERNEIPYRVEDHNAHQQTALLGSQPGNKIEIKILSEDFSKAKSLLETEALEAIENAPKDHYLFGFTTEELQDVVAKQDEWNEFDFLLAKKILAQKGVIVSEKKIEESREERIKELSAAQPRPVKWIVIGYLLPFCPWIITYFFLFATHLLVTSILIFAMGISAPLVGIASSASKRVLPDGQKVFMYDAKSRMHGKIIFVLGILIFVAFILVSWVFQLEFNVGRMW